MQRLDVSESPFLGFIWCSSGADGMDTMDRMDSYGQFCGYMFNSVDVMDTMDRVNTDLR